MQSYNACRNWKDEYTKGQEIIKVNSEEKSSEIVIIYFESSDNEPPSLICRFPNNITLPFKKHNPPSYSVVKQNINGKFHQILQKVQIVYNEAPNDRNLWSVVVSEFEIEHDFFHQLSPEDEKKLVRRFVFSSNMNGFPTLWMELGSKETKEEKQFFLSSRETSLEDIFDKLSSRKISEEEARLIFHEFEREMWLINYDILVRELVYVEGKHRTRENSVQVKSDKHYHKQVMDVIDNFDDFDEYVIGAEQEDVCGLQTEDELWEKGVFNDQV